MLRTSELLYYLFSPVASKPSTKQLFLHSGEFRLNSMNIKMFPTSHDGPDGADEVENLGFDSWIISEASDSLIDPPAD